MLEEMLRGGNRGIVGFDPTTIPGCTVWFDAADPGTFGTSGTSLQTWRSKGSATCTASFTYNAPTVSTISGLSSIYFNGVSTMMNTNRIASYGATETTWITCATSLATVSASTPADACPIIATQGAGAERSIRYTCNVNATAYSINTSVLRQTTGDNTNGVRGFIDTAAYFAGFTNGALIASNTTAVTFQPGYNQSFVMGQWNVGWLNGYIYEILIYNRALTLGEYQSVEGYLAQKWRFATANFNPTSIPGCILWLDPATQGNLTYSGANVTAIKDSSTLGNNATRYNGASYATTATVSGNTILSFPGAGITYRSAMVLTGSAYTIFTIMSLVSTTGNGSGYQRAINADSGGGTIFIGALNGNLATFCGTGGFNDIAANSPTYVLTGNGIQLVTMYVSGSSLIPYINGTAQTTKTGSTGATTVLDIGAYQNSSQNWNGYIGDVIIYNTALTTAQRQQVEGYLAWKWGLKNSLPSTHPYYLTSGTLLTRHPYYSVPPATRAFTPLDVPGCALWLDGADSATIIGNVTSVREKANNVTFTATGTVTTSTIGTTQSLNFAGAGYLSGTVNSLLVGTSFVVFRTTAANNGYYPFFTWRDNVVNSGLANFPAFGYLPGGNLIGPYTTWVGAGTPTTSVSIGNSYITSYSWSGTTTNVGFNGAIPTTGTQSAYAHSETLLWIAFDNGYYTTANIGEILIYNSILSAAQRQAVEGYLANKWGLKASIPVFANPRSIPSCAMWLDGSDPAGTGVAPANNSAISTWVDKSGNGCNATASSSNPTFLSNQYNGYGLINFSGGVYFSNATFNYNLPNRTLFIVCSSTVAGYTGFLSFNNTAGTDYSASNTMNYASPGTNSLQIAAALSAAGGGFNVFFGTGSTTQFAIYGDTFSGTTESYFMNGSNMGSTTTSTTFGASTSIYIGARQLGGFTGTYSITGTISELIIYNYAITSSQRQQVEGYLAWKWGLQASLPATHPFYATVPVPHPFNKVPPTIRQPVLYSDVAPGNWVRDWQPYLRALTRANAGATQNIGSITGGGTYTSYGWFGNVLAPNGNIYFVPYGSSNILVLNTNTGVTTNITGGATFTTFNQYRGGVLASNGNIYCVPFASTNILVINPNTGVTSNMTGSATFTSFGWHGGVLGPDGNIYCAPANALNILVIRPATGTTSNLTGGATYPGAGAWAGGVLAPNGNIYFAPNAATNILVLNTMTGVTSNLTGGATYSGSWTGGVLATNGNIYFCPYTASNVLVLNPATGVTSNLVGGASYPGGGAWAGGVLAPNGNIYFPPSGGATNILVVDPIAGTTSTLTSGVIGSSAWQGGVLSPNGTIYFTPLIATTILTVSFTGLLQTPSLNYCMSAYTNKL